MQIDIIKALIIIIAIIISLLMMDLPTTPSITYYSNLVLLTLVFAFLIVSIIINADIIYLVYNNKLFFFKVFCKTFIFARTKTQRENIQDIFCQIQFKITLNFMIKRYVPYKDALKVTNKYINHYRHHLEKFEVNVNDSLFEHWSNWIKHNNAFFTIHPVLLDKLFSKYVKKIIQKIALKELYKEKPHLKERDEYSKQMWKENEKKDYLKDPEKILRKYHGNAYDKLDAITKKKWYKSYRKRFLDYYGKHWDSFHDTRTNNINNDNEDSNKKKDKDNDLDKQNDSKHGNKK